MDSFRALTIPCLLLFVGLDVVIPPQSMVQFCGRRGTNGFKNGYVGLGWNIPAENKPQLAPLLTARRRTANTSRWPPAGRRRASPSRPGPAGPAPPPRLEASPVPARPPAARPPSPLDVALIGQEIVEDPEASGGLEVPEAHGGSGAPHAPTRSPAAAQRGPVPPAPALYSGGIPPPHRTRAYRSARRDGKESLAGFAPPWRGARRG